MLSIPATLDAQTCSRLAGGLAESWVNGNRAVVYRELANLPTAHALAVYDSMLFWLAVDDAELLQRYIAARAAQPQGDWPS